MNNEKDLAQKSLEKGKNFFFEHVQEVIKDLKKKEKLEEKLSKINNKLDTDENLNPDEFALVGICAFLIGNDYTSQAYPIKAVLKNVHNRFDELNFNVVEVKHIESILNKINNKTAEEKSNLLEKPVKDVENKLKSAIKVDTKDILLFKNLRLKLNRFIDNLIIPIAYSTGVCELKKNDLTYEGLLKINNIINDNTSYFGNNVTIFKDIYGNELFNKILNKASDIFNQTKFALVYEESIYAAAETLNRFPFEISENAYTDEEYEKFKNDYENKMKEQEVQKPIEETYESDNYTSEEAHAIMDNEPDKFVELNLKDCLRKNNFTETIDVINAIQSLSEKSDLLQYLYPYMKQNMESEKRGNSEFINLPGLVHALKDKLGEVSGEYKKLAEENCAEIPDTIRTKLVSMINETIKHCLLDTQDQKQYLISQLIENGITTWNHLQQIMSVIDTCKIFGANAKYYNEVYEFCNSKEDIVGTFEKSSIIEKLNVEMSVWTLFRDWYSYYEKTSEKSE